MGTASLTSNNSTFCPHSVFMCFVWISEQTAIISLYNINWLVSCNPDGVCLLRGTDWGFIYTLHVYFCWTRQPTIPTHNCEEQRHCRLHSQRSRHPACRCAAPNAAVCVLCTKTTQWMSPSVIARSSHKLEQYLGPLCISKSVMLIGSIRTSDI
jgi:hypothetical protein